MENSTNEAQRGKDACDQYMAIVKNRIREYVNCGGDVTNVFELKEAILSRDGLKNVKCAILEVNKGTSKFLNKPKITGIDSIHTAKFNEENKVTVWQFFEIGPGYNPPINKECKFLAKGKLLSSYEGEKTGQVVQRPITNPQPSTSEAENENDVAVEGGNVTVWDKLRDFIVTEATFEAGDDISNTSYVASPIELQQFNKIYPVGFALKKRKTNTKATDIQITFIKKAIEKSTVKVTPESIFNAMRQSGKFSTDQYITVTQIKSLISRIVKKPKTVNESPNLDEISEQISDDENASDEGEQENENTGYNDAQEEEVDDYVDLENFLQIIVTDKDILEADNKSFTEN